MAGDKKLRTDRHVAIRALSRMIDDLRALRRQLAPREDDEKGGARTGEDFIGYKDELNDRLRSVRANIERLNELRKKLGDGNRDQTMIQLQLKNTKDLRECYNDVNKLKGFLEKDEKKTGKKSVEPEELASRRQYLLLVTKEIEHLVDQNSTVRQNMSPDEQAMVERKERRLEEQRKEREAKRAERRKGRDRKGRGGKDEEEADKDLELKPVSNEPVSEQELAFQDKVNENFQEQDKMIDEIAKGLSDLKELAVKAQKELEVQEKLIEEVDNKLDQVNEQFKTANQRLADLLEATGGCSRWCPILILLVLFIAVLGYIFYSSSH